MREFAEDSSSNEKLLIAVTFVHGPNLVKVLLHDVLQLMNIPRCKLLHIIRQCLNEMKE